MRHGQSATKTKSKTTDTTNPAHRVTEENYMKLPIAIDCALPPNLRNVFARFGKIGISESAEGPKEDNDRENAEFVVTAVNHHTALVAFIEKYLSAGPGPEYKSFIHPENLRGEARELLEKVKS
jgi:hypothetical protein